jgi:hypothetical protein
MDRDNGYEYEVVGKCRRTGRPFVAPKAWNAKIGKKPIPRPRYATCLCCERKR